MGEDESGMDNGYRGFAQQRQSGHGKARRRYLMPSRNALISFLNSGLAKQVR